MAKEKLVIIKEANLNNNCPECFNQELDSSHKCNITLIVDDCRKNLVGGHEPMSFSGSVV